MTERIEVKDLSTYVQAEIDAVPYNEDGYVMCVEAMINAGYAAVEAVARELGVTGFQHSAAMLQLYAKALSIEGPFIVLRADQALYPQYNLQQKLFDFLNSVSTLTWLADEAQRRLDENESRKALDHQDEYAGAAPRVLAHWKTLVAQRPQGE